MKSSAMRLTALLLCALLLPSCDKSGKEALSDDSIPPVEMSAVETDNGYRPFDTEPNPVIVAYEDSYEGDRQKVLDACFQMKSEIDKCRGTEDDKPEYDTLLALLEPLLRDQEPMKPVKEIKFSGEYKVDATGVLDCFMGLCLRDGQRAAGETDMLALAEYLIWFSPERTYFSVGKYLSCDALYGLLFPTEDRLCVSQEGNRAVIWYTDYDGRLIYKEGNAGFFNGTIREKEIVLENYSGTICVAPLNPYGAAGRGSELTINVLDESLRGEPDTVHICGNRYVLANSRENQDRAAGTAELIRGEEINGIGQYAGLIAHPELIRIAIIEKCGLTDIGDLSMLLDKKKVEALTLSNNRLTELDVSDFDALQSLGAAANPDLCSLTLPSCKKMNAIDLARTSITDLDFLENISEITSLWIDGTGIEDISPLHGKQIGLLSIGRNITDLSVLPQIIELRSLSIETDIPLEDVLAVAEMCPSLRRVIYNGDEIKLNK